MRTAIATLLAALAIAAPAGVQAQPIATPAKVCHRGTPARIGGSTKCLQPGEYCARRYQSQYRRYGFVCASTGRLRRE